ncbi:MAG: hypothetical protein HYY48_03965 [Gammaproteobacteria bacterium]|nr:hypothetical protein [Gammaproteobacteria bacterium]
MQSADQFLKRPVALVPLLLLLAGCNQISLKQLIRPEPEELVALRDRANAAYAAEDWETAEGAYRDLTERVPGEAENWFRLGNIYVHKDRLFDAMALYREALLHDARHARAWHNLGLTQLRMATHTFVELQKYTEAFDPVNQRARQMVDGITRLLEEQPDAPAAISE